MNKLVFALLVVLNIDASEAFAPKLLPPPPPSLPPPPSQPPPIKSVPLTGKMQPRPGNTGAFYVSLKLRGVRGTGVRGIQGTLNLLALVDLGSAVFATPVAECSEVGVVDDPTCVPEHMSESPKTCCRKAEDMEPTSCFASDAQQPALHVDAPNVDDVSNAECYGDAPGGASFYYYVPATMNVSLAAAKSPASLEAKLITVSGAFFSATGGSAILGLTGNEFNGGRPLAANVNKLLQAATGGQVFGLCFGQKEGGQMLLEAPAPTPASVRLTLLNYSYYVLPPIETITVAGKEVENGPSSLPVVLDNGTWGSKLDTALLRALLESLHAPLGCTSEWLTRKDNASAETYSCCARTMPLNLDVAPSVSLTFGPGLDGVLNVPLLNYLIDLSGETCLAITAASTVSILGAHFMKDFATTFFLETNEVMLHPANEVCDRQPAWPTGAKMSLRA